VLRRPKGSKIEVLAPKEEEEEEQEQEQEEEEKEEAFSTGNLCCYLKNC